MASFPGDGCFRRMSRVVLRAGIWLAAGVALGRLAGFVREAILAAQFGRSAEGDAAVLLLTLPDTIINLLVGSAMTVVLVPPLAALRPSGGDRALVRQALVIGVLAGVGLWMGLALAGTSLVALLAPGLPGPAAAAVAAVLPIALAAIPASLASSVLGAALQERYRVATTALGTLAFNGVVIVGLMWAGPGATLGVVAVTLAVGAGLRLALQGIDYGVALGSTPPVSNTPPPSRPTGLVTAYLQTLLAGAAVLLVPVLGRAFASQAGPGEIAAYTYATKLVDLPTGMALTVVAQALFAQLAAQRAAEDGVAARALLARGLTVVLLLAGVCTGLLVVAGPLLAEAAFARGRMTLDDARHIGDLAALLAWSLPATAVASLVAGWLQAGRDTRTPLVAGVLGLGVFVVVAALGSGPGAIQGVIWGTIALQVTVLGVLVARAWRDLPWRFSVVVPGLVAGLVVVLGARGLPTEGDLIGRLGGLGILGLAALVFGGLALPEVRNRRWRP